MPKSNSDKFSPILTLLQKFDTIHQISFSDNDFNVAKGIVVIVDTSFKTSCIITPY